MALTCRAAQLYLIALTGLQLRKKARECEPFENYAYFNSLITKSFTPEPKVN